MRPAAVSLISVIGDGWEDLSTSGHNTNGDDGDSKGDNDPHATPPRPPDADSDVMHPQIVSVTNWNLVQDLISIEI